MNTTVFSRVNDGGTVRDGHGVTYSSDGGILLHVDKALFDCREYTLPEQTRIIWDGAFHGIQCLEKISLPANLEYIGEHAFCNCTSLKRIDIPEGVRTIGQCAFSLCTGLAGVKLPAGIDRIPCECFNQCESLKEIVIPEGVKGIGICGFTGCGSLSSAILPESLEWMEDQAFSSCGLLSVHLPPGVRFLGEDCFWGCPLDELVIPAGVQEIVPWTVSWHDGFRGIRSESPHFRIEKDALIANEDDSMLCCWSDDDEYVIPVSVKNLRGFANSHCRKVVAVHPMKGISYDCFCGCGSLEEVELESVESVSPYAFTGCEKVKLTIGGKRLLNK